MTPHAYAPVAYAPIPSAILHGLIFAPDLAVLDDPISGVRGVLDGTTYSVDEDYRALDGSTDRIDFGLATGSMPDLAGQACTVAMWVYLDDITNSPWLWQTQLNSGSSSAFMYVTSVGRLAFRRETESTDMIRVSNTSVVATGAWVHVACASDGSLTHANHLFYVDGVEPVYGPSQDGTGTERATTYSWSLGGWLQADTVNVAGRIRAPMVWNRQLSAAEVAVLAGLP